MMSSMVKGTVLGAIAIATLAACQTTEEALTESGAVKMADWEVEATLSNSTREWASGKGSSYYSPDGAYVWKMNSGKSGDGTWSVNDDGQMCFAVPEWYNGAEQCYTMYKKADGSIVSVGPKGEEHQLGAYQEGNAL